MPGRVASHLGVAGHRYVALTKATLPYTRAIADNGWKDALRADATLALGLNTFGGNLPNAPVANAYGFAHRELAGVLA